MNGSKGPGRARSGRASAEAPAGSRERMIEAAIDLMRGYGLVGAGINDIVRESGAPKGSVYHHFPEGKVQIAREALSVYAQRVRAFIDEALGGKRSPADKVRTLFDAFARRAEATDCRRSCAVGTVSLDLDAELDPLREVLAGAFDDWTAVIARHLDLGDARRTRSFAGLVLTAIEGAYVRSRAEGSGSAFREAGAWLAELLASTSTAPPRPAPRGP